MYMGLWERFVEYVFHVSLNYLVTIANLFFPVKYPNHFLHLTSFHYS